MGVLKYKILSEIVIVIVFAILLTLVLFLQVRTPGPEGIITTIEELRVRYPHAFCEFPIGEKGYTVCCVNETDLWDCTGEEYLKCNQTVVVKFLINFNDTEYQICSSRDLFLNELLEPASYLEPTAYIYDEKVFSCDFPVPLNSELLEPGRLPYRDGDFSIEFYTIPKDIVKNWSEENLVKSLDVFQRMLHIKLRIKC